MMERVTTRPSWNFRTGRNGAWRRGAVTIRCARASKPFAGQMKAPRVMAYLLDWTRQAEIGSSWRARTRMLSLRGCRWRRLDRSLGRLLPPRLFRRSAGTPVAASVLVLGRGTRPIAAATRNDRRTGCFGWCEHVARLQQGLDIGDAVFSAVVQQEARPCRRRRSTICRQRSARVVFALARHSATCGPAAARCTAANTYGRPGAL